MHGPDAGEGREPMRTGRRERCAAGVNTTRGMETMKDLQRFYMRLASALERTWTRQEDKRHAAILLRNAAIETPHCYFCGCDPKGDLYESRYNPKARICKLCAVEIAAEFKAQATQSMRDLPTSAALAPSGRTARGGT